MQPSAMKYSSSHRQAGRIRTDYPSDVTTMTTGTCKRGHGRPPAPNTNTDYRSSGRHSAFKGQEAGCHRVSNVDDNDLHRKPTENRFASASGMIASAKSSHSSGRRRAQESARCIGVSTVHRPTTATTTRPSLAHLTSCSKCIGAGNTSGRLMSRWCKSFKMIAIVLLLLGLATSSLLGPGQVVGSPQAPKPTSSDSGANQAPPGCPYPATNANSLVNIVAQAPAVPLLSTEFVADEYATLKPDTQASYKCDHGFELLGQETLTCLQSGRWSGSPPNCVTNIAPGKPTNQSSTVKGGDSKNANDGKLITQHDSKHCTETRVDQSPWWQIDLLQVYDIRSVRILGRACCNPQLSLHDIEIRVGNSSSLQGNRLCAWYPNNLEEGVARDFQCANPILGRFVSIQMVGIESALSLCEVMVFSTKEFPAERCSIQSTLAPTSSKSSQAAITTTTSATTTQSSTTQSSNNAENQALVFNRTCYEMQTVSGGSFLVADTYCKARGGSLVHSLTDLTQNFIAQGLEQMKSKMKAKLVWIGAKRENASPNAQGPITPGSTSALIASDSVLHHTFSHSDRSLSASLNEFPIDSLFAADRSIVSPGEPSPIFSPLKLSRTSLMQASSGAGGSTSRGSQTFGLTTAAQQQHHLNNRTIEHPGRSLSIIQPNQVASFLVPPIPIDSPPTTSFTLNSNPQKQSAIILTPQASPSSPTSSFASISTPHAPHRSLRPPSLTSPLQTPSNPSLAPSATSWSASQSAATNLGPSGPLSSQSSHSAWRWGGDAASETQLAPITSFMWADDQPNNYNNQQDCIVLDGGKRWLWNDVTCELDYLPWVCQYRPSTCGSPDRNENSTILELSSPQQDSSVSPVDSVFQFGKIITYACPVGHRLDGSKTRKCLYDGTWSGRAPKCQYINCGQISSSIENGRLLYLNQSQTTFGSQVKYVCYEDYVLVGDDTRQCQGDGKWGGKAPYCAYKWCPVLQTISNGQINVTSYSENSLATYQCNSGYKLIGNDTRQCLLGGKWTNQEPFCQYVDCGQPKQIPNGSHQLINGTTNYLSVVEYKCNENFTLANGNSNRMVCSHNNRWTGKEPQCSLIYCGQPQANLGSRFSGDSFAVHSTIDYRCDPGFKEVSGNTQRTCGLDGQWTGQPLTCKYVDCGRVPAILKGEISYINGTTYLASQVSYECTPGNRLSGHRVRFCGPDARWTGTSPKCEEVRCDAPELPANGSAIYIGNDRSSREKSFSVGVTVQYECDYGHVVKGSWSSRLCQANGDWSGEPPVCKFVDCGPPPTIENGIYQLKHPPASSLAGGLPSSSGGSSNGAEFGIRRSSEGTGSPAPNTFTYYGTIAQYSCDPNYRLQGQAQRECLESGQWRTPLPTCEPIQCPKPEHFDEYTQVVLISRSAQLAALATLSTGSSSPSIMGPDSSNNGQLDHQALIALASTSKSTKLIANNQWLIAANGGADSAASTSFGVGDKLYYSCTPGYELYGGPELRTCTQYGQWSGSSTPRCRLIDCGRPSPIGQEGRFYLLNETTTFNSLVEYSCVRPFKLIEVKMRQSGNLIETLTNAQAGVTPILTSLPIGVKVCANNGQWMPNDQQPKCTSGAPQADPSGSSNSNGAPASGSHFDGIDNTLDGSHRSIQVLAGNQLAGNANHNNHNNQLLNQNDGTIDNLDSNSGGYHQQQQQQGSTSLWAKLIIAICLLIMLALIILTLICIRSGRKPKQVQIHRASILTPSGHQAAAAAALQIQLASSGKGLQSQHQIVAAPTGSAGPPGHLHHNHPHQQHPSMLPGQNIYINGMHKMLPGSMVGQSQMSTMASSYQSDHHNLPIYGDASSVQLSNMIGHHQNATNRASMAADSHQHHHHPNQQQQLMTGNGKSGPLGSLAQHQQRQQLGDHHGLGSTASSSSIMDTYSRLSIDSDQTNIVGGGHSTSAAAVAAAANKTIRHNPNGLVTFVSPAQQQTSARQQHQSSTAPSQHHHQVSPQSISTSLSVSSSSSPSSSSSSAPHTTATRLSGTDSAASPTSGSSNGTSGSNNHSHNTQSKQQQQLSDNNDSSDYQIPSTYSQAPPPPLPQTSPPSLPAQPPPPHRVQQHHKQLMKYSSKQTAASRGTNQQL